MPVTSTELFRPGTRAGDSDGAKDHRVRVFRVDCMPDAALILGPTGTPDPLPLKGDPYPGGNQTGTFFPLTMDRYGVSITEDGASSYVECYYSNDRSGRIRPVADQTRPGYYAWNMSVQKTTQDVPTVLTFPLYVPGVTINADVPGVENKTYKCGMTYGVYELTLPLQGVTTTTVDTIRAQNDHLHFFGGKFWRFELGQISPVEPGVWLAQYRWIGDDGLDLITGVPFTQAQPYDPFVVVVGDPADNRKWYFPSPQPNRLQPYAPPPTQFPDMTRTPFHVLTYVLTSSAAPQYEQACPFVIEPEGWRSLPGQFNL